MKAKLLPFIILLVTCCSQKNSLKYDLHEQWFYLGEPITAIRSQGDLVWVGTGEGNVYTFNPRTGTFAKKPFSFSKMIYDIMPLSDGKYAFGIRDGGVQIVGEDGIECVLPIPMDRPVNYSPYTLLRKDHYLYTATSNGLYRFDLTTKDCLPIFTDTTSLMANRFQALAIVGDRIVFCGESGIFWKPLSSTSSGITKLWDKGGEFITVDTNDINNAFYALDAEGKVIHYSFTDTRGAIDVAKTPGAKALVVEGVKKCLSVGYDSIWPWNCESLSFQQSGRIKNDRLRHIADITEDYIFIASQSRASLMRFPNDDLWEASSFIVSICDDFTKDACWGLTNDSDLYQIQPNIKPKKYTRIGGINGFNNRFELRGRMSPGLVYISTDDKKDVHVLHGRKLKKNTALNLGKYDYKDIAVLDQYRLALTCRDSVYVFSLQDNLSLVKDQVFVIKTGTHDENPERVRLLPGHDKDALLISILNSKLLRAYDGKTELFNEHLSLGIDEIIKDVEVKPDANSTRVFLLTNKRLIQCDSVDIKIIAQGESLEKVDNIAYAKGKIYAFSDSYNTRGGLLYYEEIVNDPDQKSIVPHILLPGHQVSHAIGTNKAELVAGGDFGIMFGDLKPIAIPKPQSRPDNYVLILVCLSFALLSCVMFFVFYRKKTGKNYQALLDKYEPASGDELQKKLENGYIKAVYGLLTCKEKDELVLALFQNHDICDELEMIYRIVKGVREEMRKAPNDYLDNEDAIRNVFIESKKQLEKHVTLFCNKYHGYINEYKLLANRLYVNGAPNSRITTFLLLPLLISHSDEFIIGEGLSSRYRGNKSDLSAGAINKLVEYEPCDKNEGTLKGIAMAIQHRL